MNEAVSLNHLSSRADQAIARLELKLMTPEQCRSLAVALEPFSVEQRAGMSAAELVTRFSQGTGLTEQGAEEFRALFLVAQSRPQAPALSPVPSVPTAPKKPSIAGALLLIFGIVGGMIFLKQTLNPGLPPHATQSKTAGLTRAELNQRIARAIGATKNSKVVYQDVQGEGAGHWDAGPRYPRGTVNCIVWITQVIAEAFAQGRADKTPVLDRLRYFGGHVSFGTRKHYLAQSMALEPDPLKQLSLKGCASELVQPVALDYDRFIRANAYSCPLYRSESARFDVKYVDPDGLLSCATKLSPGIYVMFGVATDKYDEMYGKESGPLGLVHGMFLEVPSSATIKTVKVHHASTAAKRVKVESLKDYVAKMRQSLHRGYAVYELDPTWDPDRVIPADAETLKIQTCEQNLFQAGKSRRKTSDF